MSAVAGVDVTKLPVWKTVGEAYGVWARNFPALIRIAWLWLAIMAPIVFALMWWQAPHMAEIMMNARTGAPDPSPADTVMMQVFNGIVLIPILSSIAVAWHRLLLRGEQVSGPYVRLDAVVIGYAVLFFIIGFMPAVPQYLGQLYLAATQPEGASEIDLTASLLGGLGGIASLVIWFFACRLFMVLPAKALDRKDVTVGVSWAATTGNSWRLFWGYLLCLLPFMLFGSGLALWLLFGSPTRTSYAAISAVLSLLWALFGMVAVGFLSLAYRFFFERSA
jgi:hypothetical protein